MITSTLKEKELLESIKKSQSEGQRSHAIKHQDALKQMQKLEKENRELRKKSRASDVENSILYHKVEELEQEVKELKELIVQINKKLPE